MFKKPLLLFTIVFLIVQQVVAQTAIKVPKAIKIKHIKKETVKKEPKHIVKADDKKDSVAAKPEEAVVPGIKFSGYVDAYYGYYTDSVGINEYQKFPSVSPRSDHIGLNSALLTAQYDAEKTRGIISLHFGDIPRCAWSSTFNAIMEAHAGVRLTKKTWLEAGFFRTHFGTEGLLPKENLVSSVAVPTFYEPLFESGLRLNYNPNDKLAIYINLLNGYNLFEDNNDKKSLGILVTYALGDKGNIGYSNYFGDDAPRGDSIIRTRFNQNLFWNYQVKKLKIQVGADYCIQQHADLVNPEKPASMFSGLATLKYQVKTKFAVSARGEIFNDPQGFMAGIFIDKNGFLTGYKLWGATLCFEYKHTENSYLRIEGRQLMMDKDQQIFRWDGMDKSIRSELTTSMGLSF